MSSSLTPNALNETFRSVNVSSPSVVHSRPSQHSITASEDYYSLSASSNSSGRSVEAPNAAAQSQHTITRYQTPPSRYRTPQASRDLLPLTQQQQQQQQQSQNAQGPSEEQFRKTPMRGQGKRRSSAGEGSVVAGAGAMEPLLQQNQTQQSPQQREGGIRRKPVPSRDMDQEGPSHISPQHARSSVYRDIDRSHNAPTPGVDDTPFLHFALDQLTRDEEVRGSRRYPGIAPGIDGEYPYITPPNVQAPIQQRQQPQSQPRYAPVPQEEERDIVEQSPYPHSPPPKNPDRMVVLNDQPQYYPQVQRPQGPNVFIPVPVEESRQPPLNFLPGILRPLPLGLYTFLVLAYIICLIIAAAWSASDTGLVNYGSFGDGRYFVFQYLPTMLGIILLFWLFEIQKALYRVAPFIAMFSGSPSSRIVGASLPLQPNGFVLPYFGHFAAKLPIIGMLLFVAWLQLFTIPLLGSSFNVYQSSGQWIWIATQGVIWTVIALYILLLAALIVLLVWLWGRSTGLKWDPRSLADIIVLVERSNALDGLGDGVPQLGYFRASHRPNEIFHTYGIVEKPARSYSIVNNQLREKRHSDLGEMDLETGQPRRLSNEKMLLRYGTDDTIEKGGVSPNGSALPWFLRPSLALLWPIIAIVLLLAFLIVSYLPSTTVANGFTPQLPASTNTSGFSSTNFLYSFIPTLLATLCMLFWLDIDLAYRRLTPFESLCSIIGPTSTKETETIGSPAERTLLPSYTADLPILITLSALFNTHIRLAFLTGVSLLTATLPILASGCFWSQFSIPTQRVLIYAHMPAYYALTVFLTLYALAYLVIYPSSSLTHTALPANINTFAGIRDLLHQSRLLDDVRFRNPTSKTDLVTRLLSPAGTPFGISAAATSKISLADSVRGFGRARAAPGPSHSATASGPASTFEPARYAFGRSQGRDGREYLGIDLVRR